MKLRDVVAAVADLAGDNPARREAAIAVLESMPIGFLEDHSLPRKKVAPFIPKLAQLLDADVPVVVKEWCAQMIGESYIRTPELLQSLIRALEIDDDKVLMSAIWAIGEYGPKGMPAVDALICHTAHLNPEVRWRAVWAIRESRPQGQSYAQLFASLFDDENHLVRGYAVLGFIATATPSPWAVAQLQRAAADAEQMPRGHAQRALEQWAANGAG